MPLFNTDFHGTECIPYCCRKTAAYFNFHYLYVPANGGNIIFCLIDCKIYTGWDMYYVLFEL